MKKLFGILMAVLAVVPLVGVKAIEGNYYVYGAGDEVNFYTYEGDEVGTRTIILEDEGANSQYVRTLATGVTYYTSNPWYEKIDAGVEFPQTSGFQGVQNVIQQQLHGAGYVRNVQTEVSLLTLNDLINVFGATPTGNNTYTFDFEKWGTYFAGIKTSAKGLWTQTLSEDKQSVWAIKFQRNSDSIGDVTSATIELVPVSEGGYAYMPVLYMDKTYDCHERDAQDKFACYECGEDIKWYEIGTQPESCQIIENIKSENTCVKNEKTGIDQYFIQFGLIAGICAIALVAVNRKNLFRSI